MLQARKNQRAQPGRQNLFLLDAFDVADQTGDSRFHRCLAPGSELFSALLHRRSPKGHVDTRMSADLRPAVDRLVDALGRKNPSVGLGQFCQIWRFDPGQHVERFATAFAAFTVAGRAILVEVLLARRFRTCLGGTDRKREQRGHQEAQA